MRIASEEGLVGLWSPGLVATWLRAFTQTGLRLGLYPRRTGCVCCFFLFLCWFVCCFGLATAATAANPW